MDGCVYYTQKRWLFLLTILFILECYLNVSVHSDVPHVAEVKDLFNVNTTANSSTVIKNETLVYKYPLINAVEVPMDNVSSYNSSYYWFMSMKHKFKNVGEDEIPIYKQNTPVCRLNKTSLGRIKVKKNEVKLEWIEKQNPDVKLGGYYAPAQCRATHRVAVIVPYRDRRKHLGIFLRYLHPLLKKQFLEYRIFIIEQNGSEKFNRGILFNIGFLETQRFGRWDCLIFHDVDLIPEDERIPYSCQENPTHMSTAVESLRYALPYRNIFGGITALTPAQFESVNGYSNLYWNWGAEDDDLNFRIQSKNYTVCRYNSSIARFASLPHRRNVKGKERSLLLMTSKLRFLKEGLKTTNYNLIKVTKEKLYTHLLADVNPTKMKLGTKSLMKHIVNLYGKKLVYGENELKLAAPASL